MLAAEGESKRRTTVATFVTLTLLVAACVGAGTPDAAAPSSATEAPGLAPAPDPAPALPAPAAPSTDLLDLDHITPEPRRELLRHDDIPPVDDPPTLEMSTKPGADPIASRVLRVPSSEVGGDRPAAYRLKRVRNAARDGPSTSPGESGFHQHQPVAPPAP